MQIQRRYFPAFLREFNYNDRLAYCLVGVIIAIVGVLEYSEVYTHEDIYNGYDNFVSKTIEPACSWDSLPYARGGLNWYFVCVSYLTFDNSRVLPFVISIGLIPITFLFVRKYSNNFIALSSTLGLVFNPVFLIFDSSSAYAQSWAILLISSLYLLKKNPILSIPLFNLSIFCKAIPMAWGPLIILDYIRTRKKSRLFISLGIGVPITILYILSIFDGGTQVYGALQFKPISPQSITDLLQWTKIAFRWNEEIIIGTPILFIIYFMKRKSWNLDSYPFKMLAISTISFFAIALLTVEGYFPYRLIPNIVMFLFAASALLYSCLSKNVFKHIVPPSIQ